MSGSTLTPEAAPGFVEGLSSDIVACVLVDADGRVSAPDGADMESAEELGRLGAELLERAGAPQIEVSTGTGIVYALRGGGRTLVVVTSRFALSSLVFFDMRKTLEGIGA